VEEHLRRITLIVILTVVSVIVLAPSLTDKVPAGWKDKMPRINLGLDLQGGVFLRLAVEIDKAIENTILRYADDARGVCAKGTAGPGLPEGGDRRILLRSPGRLRRPGRRAAQGRVSLPRRGPGRGEVGRGDGDACG